MGIQLRINYTYKKIVNVDTRKLRFFAEKSKLNL
jgi:hypothetical protein